MAEFLISKSTDGKVYWELRGNNHETLCVSETYNQKQSALDTIERVKEQAASAKTIDNAK